ncbi:MAG: hypothetical protein VXX63_07740 [Bacteroidota bacterium]|nr:hypothetical protein [Bacteroidota bacterium]
MKVHFYFLSFAILAVLSFSGCKECSDPTNPECENYDPCHNSKPANADFTINEQINATDFYYESDTIYRVNGTLFKPKHDADSITWLLGAEIVHQKELYRRGYPEGWIEVTMIAKMNPSGCLTQEQRIDTVTKQFYVLPSPGSLDSTITKASPWWGTWEGYNTDEPNDKFTVSWGYIFGSNLIVPVVMDFVGLPKGIKKQIPFYTLSGSRSWAIEVRVGYKALRLLNIQGDHWIGGGFALEGTCFRVGNNMTIEYSYNDTPYQRWLNGEERQVEPVVRVNKTFVATKISNQVLTEE